MTLNDLLDKLFDLIDQGVSLETPVWVCRTNAWNMDHAFITEAYSVYLQNKREDSRYPLPIRIQITGD